MKKSGARRFSIHDPKIYDLTGNILVWILIVVIFVGLPLFLRTKYVHIADGKYIFLTETARWTAVVAGFFAAAYYSLRGLSGKELKAFKAVLPTDISVLAYILVTIVSYAVSEYKNMGGSEYDLHAEGALWGASGWYMGLITYLIMVLFYLLTSRFFLYTDRFLIPVLTAGELAFLWGILNRFRFSLFGFDGDDPKFIGSFGNINWFCGYACVIVPLIMGLYWYKGKENRLLYGSLLFSGFLTMIVNGSDSGILALFLTMLFLFVYSLKDLGNIMAFSEIALIFSVADFLMAFLMKLYKYFLNFEGMLTTVLTNFWVSSVILAFSLGLFLYLRNLEAGDRIYPVFMKRVFGKIVVALTVFGFGVIVLLIVINTVTGGKVPIIGKNPFFIFDRTWGTLRGTDWEAAIRLFSVMDPLHKLFGCGPDCFWFLALDHTDIHKMIELNFHSIRLTNAHCEFLTILVDQGILGLAAYIAISVTMFKVLIKRLKDHPGFMMFLLCIIMYHANNLISFEQITSTPFFYLILGIGAAAVVAGEKPVRG